MTTITEWKPKDRHQRERNTRVDTPQFSGTAAPSPTRDHAHAVWYHLGGRHRLLIVATVMVVAGVASSWNWLAALGIAPLVLALLPCVAMCALGLCMSRMGGSRSPRDGALGMSPLSAPPIDRPLPKAADRDPPSEPSSPSKG